ncbi:MAG TPA: hypothetical protein VNT75_04535 [Symbiobacteriaceae bacterium]|nr:hypothetical protein [Symbiobacteriaceae bacterium]
MRRYFCALMLTFALMAGCAATKEQAPQPAPPAPKTAAAWLAEGRAAEAAGAPGEAIDIYRRGLTQLPGTSELNAALQQLTDGLASRATAALDEFLQDRRPETYSKAVFLLDAFLRLPESRSLATAASDSSLAVMLSPTDGVRVINLYSGPLQHLHTSWVQWFDGDTVHAQFLFRASTTSVAKAGLPDGPGSRGVVIVTSDVEHPYQQGLELWRLDPETEVWKPSAAFGAMPEVVGLGRIYSSPERVWAVQYGERAGWLDIEAGGRRISLRGDGIIPVVYAEWNGQRYEVVGK